MKQLLFVRANAKWPAGIIWSTARRGDKWSKDVKGGDVVALMETESGRHLGNATVIKTELTTLKNACDNAAADNNHATALGMDDNEAAAALHAALVAGYGDGLKDDEPFTVIILMAHNPDVA